MYHRHKSKTYNVKAFRGNGKNKLYTQSGEYKRKEMTGKTIEMINNLRDREKGMKKTNVERQN